MPSIICSCGELLSYGEIPCPIEWLVISDTEYDNYQGMINSEALYLEMKSMLKCTRCGRLWIFWNGFNRSPSCYTPEP